MSLWNNIWNWSFWLLLIFHLGLSGVGLSALRSPRCKVVFFKMPLWTQKLIPLVFVGSVLLLPVTPQPRCAFMAAQISLTAGLWMLGIACLIWLLAFRAIGFIPSIRPAKGLVDTGPYAVVRHPIYTGNLLATLGMALAFRAEGALLYWPMVLAVYLTIIRIEEKDLRQAYGRAYAAFVKNVPYRLIPYVF